MMTSMEKPNIQQQHQQQQQQQQQQALKCPRCDSSNTKFCYYNNYSLSQPRHFCKACKRYWTRGGTLRNVPVGGGCRKNKRVKRPNSASSASASSAVDVVSPTNPNPPSSTSANHLSPLFYGLANSNNNSSSSSNFSFATRFNSNSGYELNNLGIGYSSSDIGTGFSVNPNTLLSSYSNIFASSSCTSTSATTTPPPPTIASLLASTLHQHKFGGSVKSSQPLPNHFQNMADFDQQDVNGLMMMKDIKLEGQNRMEWNVACQNNQIEQIGLSDPTVYWNPSGGGAWHDPANIGSSVTSLI